MSRGLSPAQLAAATGRHYQVAPLVEFYFDAGTLRFTLAPFNIVIGSDTYLSTGPLGSIEQMTEAAGSFEGMQFGLSGVDVGIVDIATGVEYHGRLVQLLKAYLDAETNAVIGSPVVHWIGRMRSMTISEKNDSASVVLQAEHYEAELQRASPLRWNGADQQQMYPGDLGCDQVETMTEIQLTWPAREALRK
jgi:hypothetical protein